MHALIKSRIRNASTSAIAPSPSSPSHSPTLAAHAARILYRSPLPAPSSCLPLFVLNAAALPSAKEISYDALLPYVLSRLPDEEELLSGRGYEVIFFAGGGGGGGDDAAGGGGGGARDKERPSLAWMVRAYHVLSRATRKRMTKLCIVHERRWVRVCVEGFGAVVSPKVRRKIVHCASLAALAAHVPLEDVLVPPAAFACDRALLPRRKGSSSSSSAEGRKGRRGVVRRAFGVAEPLPVSEDGAHRLPRVLRECTAFLLLERNPATEGLFRVNARAATVDILAEAYDRGQKFVVWKEGPAVLCFPCFRQGFGDVVPAELECCDGFGVHAAAGLVKRWYAELREPVFPVSCYGHLKAAYGSGTGTPTASRLYADLRADAEHAPFSPTARRILTRHLLPLLAHVAAREAANHMSPTNLARCLAPNLIRGADPRQEMAMAAIASAFLEAAITHWATSLAPQLGLSESDFYDSLRMPEAVGDREDPPPEPLEGLDDDDDELDGITMVDNDGDWEEDAQEVDVPVLPPRRPEAPASAAGEARPPSAVLSRKPAPASKSTVPVAHPPAGMASTGVARSTTVSDPAAAAAAGGEKRNSIPSSIVRKPVSKASAPAD